MIAAALVVIAAVVAIVVTQLSSSSGSPTAAPTATAHASPAAGTHPAAATSAATGPGAATSAPGQLSCTAQSIGTAVRITGPTATMCDPDNGFEVPIPLTGVPGDGDRFVLQVGGSVFVLAGDTLWWRQVDAPSPSWRNLGSAPDGTQQNLCSTQPGTVIAAASDDTAQGGGTPWVQVTVPAASPVHVGKQTEVASDPCGAGPDR